METLKAETEPRFVLRSWKTWKVMKFKNYISRPGKSWRIEFTTGRLVAAGEKSATV